MSEQPAASDPLRVPREVQPAAAQLPDAQGAAPEKKVWPPTQRELAARVSQLPHKPGVYLFRDQLNRIIYVGKAKDLHRRVAQYFHASRRMTADRKTRALLDTLVDFEVHLVRSDAESVLLEGRLIKEYRPKYNVSFRDDKRFLLLKVDLNTTWPRFTLTRMKKEDNARYFGPFPHSGALRNTLNLLTKKFNLRSCRPEQPGETDFKHCLDHIIRNCSAPCVARITREQYMEKVSAACDFLEGHTQEMQQEIRAEMHKAAEALDFERAAELRDQLDALKKTTKPMRRFERDIPSTVIPERDLAELATALGLPEAPRHIECFDISNISDNHKVASLVVFRDGRPDRFHYRRYRIKSVEGQDDFASMAEVVYRRYRRVLGFPEEEGGSEKNKSRHAEKAAALQELQQRENSTAEEITAQAGDAAAALQQRLPSLIMVDGGKGQISAAMGSFSRLGVLPRALIGLAKQNEEVFRPDQSEPLILPRDSPALRLLQRVRDEAHRVANGYNALLLARRISESLLDDCPGVSAARKATLLQQFGSIKRIKSLTPSELATAPGISEKLATQILDYLQRGKVRTSEETV